MGYKQVGKTVSSTVESATVEEFTTAIADKTHLANLITTLKSELASANALLKIKEKDYHDAKEQLKHFKGDLNDANKRVSMLEKQCDNYRQTVRIFIMIVKFVNFVENSYVFFLPSDQTFGRSSENTFRYHQAT